MFKVAVVLAVLAVLAQADEYVRYDGHKAIRVQKNSTARVGQWLFDNVDIWGADGDFIDMRVTPEQLTYLHNHGVNTKILVEDLQPAIDAEYAELAKRPAFNGSVTDPTWFTAYHTYEEINTWFAAFPGQYPNRVRSVGIIGNSHQGRNLVAYTISDYTVGETKAQIYIQGLIHAREWIAGATVQYIAYMLATATDAETLAVLRDFEIHVVPIMNPDGYSFTWGNGGRLWRKNRRANTGGSFGVDNNRNFDDHWGQGGSSTNPTSDTYMGPSVASEPETQAVQRYTCSKPFIAAIDYHSYSQLVLRPYGWSSIDSPDEALLKLAGDGIRDNIRSVSGLTYTSQKSIQLYITTGTASDWFYGDKIRACLGQRTYGYTIELRPVGANPGFQLPPTQILPTGAENYPAFLRFVQFAKNNPLSGR